MGIFRGTENTGLSQGPSLDCTAPGFFPDVVFSLQKPRLLFDWNDTVKGIYGLLLYFPFGKVSEMSLQENLQTENHLDFLFSNP